MLDDWARIPSPKVRAALAFLNKQVLEPESLDAGDLQALRDAGVSDAAIWDAAHVAYLFQIYNRAADSFGFALPSAKQKMRMTRFLLKIGYI